MKSWKKRWEEELDEKIPELREDVKNQPIVECEKETEKKPSAFTLFFANKKRLWTAVSACACAVLIACIAILSPLFFGTPSAPSSQGGVFAVEINPRVAFTVNEGGMVESIVSLNADADVILSDGRSSEIEGKTAKEGIKIYVDYAAKLGYLNLADGDAVRVSSCGKNTQLSEVGNALQEYFRERGTYIAVIGETLEAEGFAQRIGIDLSQTSGKIAEYINTVSEVFAVREAEGKTDAELDALYRTFVSAEEAFTQVRGLIEKNLQEAKAKAESVQGLYSFNQEIRSHEDNPYRYFADYWELKKLDKEYSDALNALLTEMENKLNAYKTTYGAEIVDFATLTRFWEEAEEMAIESVFAIFSDLTAEVFDENPSFFLSMLEKIGMDTSKIDEIYALPTDFAEYVEKTSAYLQDRYAERLEKGKAAYEAVREKISVKDYEGYMKKIVDEYGSLEGYWNAVKK